MRHLVRPSALVAALFDTLTPAQAQTVRALQKAVLAVTPELDESVKWGNLTFMLRGRNLMAVMIHRQHVNLQFFNGATLAAEFGVLEGAGRGTRHLRVRYGQEIDVDLVHRLVQASISAAIDGSRPANDPA